MKNFTSVLIRFVHILSLSGAWLSFVCILALFAIILCGTLSRYFFNKPILGFDEISGYLNVLIGFLALAYTLQEKRHVRVDIVTGKLSHNPRLVLEVFSSIFALILIGQFLRTGWYTWVLLIERDERAQTYLRIPLDIPYGFMILGWVIFLLAIIVHLAEVIQEARLKKRKLFDTKIRVGI